MNTKKYAVVYQSRNGNTKAVAERIAKNLGVDAISIEDRLDGEIDHLFIGCGAYMHNMDKKLKDYIEKLPKEQIKKVTPFSTSGSDKTINQKIADEFKKHGVAVAGEGLVITFLLKGHAFILQKGGKLSKKQESQIDLYCRGID